MTLSINKNFLNKTSLFQATIMTDLIGKEINSKIPTVAEFEKRFNCGRGIIQKVLEYLQNENFIKIKASGYLGSYLEYIDDIKLLNSLGINEIVGSMPLLYSDSYNKLSEEVYNIFKDNYKFYLSFVRGSITRMNLLNSSRFEFSIVSESSAINRIKQYQDIVIVHDFGENSYIKGHALVFSNTNIKTIEDGMIVGIDLESKEQTDLTYEICKGKKVRYLELSYNNFLTKLYSKKIDALVWSIDGIEDFTKNYITLKNNPSNNKAVLIVSKNREYIGRFISKLIKNNKIKRGDNG